MFAFLPAAAVLRRKRCRRIAQPDILSQSMG
jgi:hypothetical protein